MSSTANRNITVMVVDDDNDLRELLTQMLESEGYQVLSAGSGSEALEIARIRNLDLILMDIGMPDLDGLSTLWEIRSLQSTVDVPTIILTAYDSYDLRAEAASAGCSAYLVKPVELQTLQSTVKKALNEDF